MKILNMPPDQFTTFDRRSNNLKMEDNKLNDKAYLYLVHLFDMDGTRQIHDFLQNSDVFIEYDHNSSFAGARRLIFLVDPEAFKRNQNDLHWIERAIREKLYQFSQEPITSSKSIANLKKFQVLTNTLVPVTTPWEEINSGQKALVDQLRSSSTEMEFQNVGNSARTLLMKLASEVFDPEKHTAEQDVKLGEAFFKNRLHTYIRNVLGGSQNKDLRDYALSLITTTEKSVDLSNKLTHDLKADSLIAEVCVISTISTISIIKLIYQKN